MPIKYANRGLGNTKIAHLAYIIGKKFLHLHGNSAERHYCQTNNQKQ